MLFERYVALLEQTQGRSRKLHLRRGAPPHGRLHRRRHEAGAGRRRPSPSSATRILAAAAARQPDDAAADRRGLRPPRRRHVRRVAAAAHSRRLAGVIESFTRGWSLAVGETAIAEDDVLDRANEDGILDGGRDRHRDGHRAERRRGPDCDDGHLDRPARRPGRHFERPCRRSALGPFENTTITTRFCWPSARPPYGASPCARTPTDPRASPRCSSSCSPTTTTPPPASTRTTVEGLDDDVAAEGEDADGPD